MESLFAATGHVYYAFASEVNFMLHNILGDQAALINLKYLIAEVGISNAYDLKGKYRWNAPYSKALIEAAVKEIHKQYLIEKGIIKNALCLTATMYFGAEFCLKTGLKISNSAAADWDGSIRISSALFYRFTIMV